ncbi:Protein of unknown function [Noviherbaspirillum humi]|uniref:YetF C-terminal domain-containing protein n=1 Tax=Noviherbaspirillum humi TaxID=1688639 RepID=A0A239HZL8_9BURK|nr:YetF domain-containing protein [Noviherbaspirillum humi]SNS86966.1 Protein of unknown function [Noviherbaspirillum humi]
MEIILRAAAIYFFLLVLFRLTGTRTLSELTTFDMILLLILSEAVQNALVDEDKSVVTGIAVVTTFVMMDLGLSILKKRFRGVERIAEGVPVVLVDRGKLLEEQLARTHVTRTDILQTARQDHGIAEMSQIKYAVLETSGGISIIPVEKDMEQMLEEKIEAALRRVLAQK